MIELAHLLQQYLASRNLRPAWPDGDGALIFKAQDGTAVGACLWGPVGLELFANPGYLDATQLERMLDYAGSPEGEDDAGLLERWSASGATWRLAADRDTGKVTLSRFSAQLPRDADGFAADVDSLCAVLAEWSADLEPEPPAQPTAHAAAGAAFLHDTFLLV